MFGKLKEKLKGALSLFSRKAEEEVKVVEEVLEDVEETPKKETEKKEVQKRVKEEIIEEKEVKKEKKKEKESVLIFHGWEDNSQSGFIPNLKKYLNQNNYGANSFDQPNTDKPQFEEWFSFAENKIKEANKDQLHLVGHSMGGLLALKLAEKYKVKKLILVAPVGSRPSKDYFTQCKDRLNSQELESFRKYQDQPLDIKKIKRNVSEIAFVFGLKDQWITDEIRNFYVASFKDIAEIHLFPEHAHMSESEGVKELPLLNEFFERKLQPGIIEHREDKKEIVEEKKQEQKIVEVKKEKPSKKEEKKKVESKEEISGVKITYFVHGTTTDNEKEISSGWNDVELSKLGVRQSIDLWDKVKDKHFDVVFCSDLKRAVQSTKLTFKNKVKIIQDKRLRECNYGKYNTQPSEIVEPVQEQHITKRFPNGESYEDVKDRIIDFLIFLKNNYEGKSVAIVAHKAPQLALDVLLKNKTWEQAFADDWRKTKSWQPGWEYVLESKIEITKRAIEVEKPKEQIIEKIEKEIPEKKGFFQRITEAITTKTISAEKFDGLFWDLEVALLENNVSVEVIEKIKEDLKEELVDKPLPRDVPHKIQETLKNALTKILSFDDIDLLSKIKKKKPFVIAFFGINGAGKTTSIAKLAHYLQQHKISVVLAACDTFRAAAIQQLEEHATKLGVKMIKQNYGSDAAAVAFDAIKYAEKNKVDVVLIDTAGRLHSNVNLMAELEKIIRVTKPDLKIFVGESITGNDCIEQARKFNELVEMDGVILTK